LQTAITTQADRLAALRNPLLSQRANDLRDVGLRVLGILTGEEAKAPDYPPNTILIAEDLTPSDTAALDRTRVMGFATTRGGATSHGAILARSLGIPALAGVEPAALEVPNETSVVLDGSKGTLRLNPPPEEITRIRSVQERAEKRHKEDLAHARAGGALTANALKRREHRRAKGSDTGCSSRGEGVGLLRSDFFSWSGAQRRAKTNSSEALKQSRRPLAKSIRSSFARSTSAVTNHSLICRFRKKTIRFWANGCASRSISPEILRIQLRAPFYAHNSSVG
jgi:phosphocarrier protein FPr